MNRNRDIMFGSTRHDIANFRPYISETLLQSIDSRREICHTGLGIISSKKHEKLSRGDWVFCSRPHLGLRISSYSFRHQTNFFQAQGGLSNDRSSTDRRL